MSNKGKAGSQIDLQLLVAHPEVINEEILRLNPEWEGGTIKWFSPISDSNYREFYDNSFNEGRFNKKEPTFWEGIPKPDFNEFWPKGGPHWDGIAVVTQKNGNKSLILVEAKAHKKELSSNCGAKESSRSRIKERLEKTKKEEHLSGEDWMKKFYQFANRLTFLLHLRKSTNNAAFLYILFANDPYWDKKDPTHAEVWKEAVGEEREYFGIEPEYCKNHCIYDVIVDLNETRYLPLKTLIEKRLAQLKNAAK